MHFSYQRVARRFDYSPLKNREHGLKPDTCGVIFYRSQGLRCSYIPRNLVAGALWVHEAAGSNPARSALLSGSAPYRSPTFPPVKLRTVLALSWRRTSPRAAFCISFTAASARARVSW